MDRWATYQGALTDNEVAPLAANWVSPTLSIAKDGVNVKITYTGKLQSATAVTGPWTDVSGASPVTVVPTAAQTFYRAKK